MVLPEAALAVLVGAQMGATAAAGSTAETAARMAATARRSMPQAAPGSTRQRESLANPMQPCMQAVAAEAPIPTALPLGLAAQAAAERDMAAVRARPPQASQTPVAVAVAAAANRATMGLRAAPAFWSFATRVDKEENQYG